MAASRRQALARMAPTLLAVRFSDRGVVIVRGIASDRSRRFIVLGLARRGREGSLAEPDSREGQ